MARNEGFGTALTTVLVPVEDKARNLLRIPDGYRIAAHLAVGKRADVFPGPLRRKPVGDFATIDAFDGSPFTLPLVQLRADSRHDWLPACGVSPAREVLVSASGPAVDDSAAVARPRAAMTKWPHHRYFR